MQPWISALLIRETEIQIKLEFGNVGFWGEGKIGVLEEKPLGAGTSSQRSNSNSYVTSGLPELLSSSNVYEREVCMKPTQNMS